MEMEIDITDGNHQGEFNEDGSAEHSSSQNASDVSDVSSGPEILPRIGDEYQVEIPLLVAVSDYLRLSNNPTDAETAAGGFYDLKMGLPIPVMWINVGVQSKKHESEAAFDDAVDVSQINVSLKSDNMIGKAEAMDVKSNHGILSGESAKFTLKQKVMSGKDSGRVYPVPGSTGDNWSDIEEASFLLGLYIFGKDLVLVQKFVGSKKMGDILSFYYENFYGSERYKRWLPCKKSTKRKCGFGERIFFGSRQQELLSRLLPNVSEECRNSLLEVSKAFRGGKMLLEEYVFILKARAGLNALVEAVGIGKCKQDLTGFRTETSKSNQVPRVRPEIPIGKACSTLTPLEIVHFLTGDFRLSKARSSDLFWEAVWPRLLETGWHSEQPNFATGSKNSLVFIIPGIKKFSRRKLVKGTHYFDSVTDVLSKVGSDPKLLDIEMGANKSPRSKDENGWTSGTKLAEEDLPTHKRHCYLKPRTPIPSAAVVKFTVVDTSLASGKASKVRELRSLPIELKISTLISDSEDDEGDTSEESTDTSHSSDTLCSHRDEINVPEAIKTRLDGEDDKHVGFDDWKNQVLGRRVTNVTANIRTDDKYLGYDASAWKNQVFGQTLTANIFQGQKVGICNDMQRRKAMKCQKSRKVPENTNPVAPDVSKRRRRLAACSIQETTSSRNYILQGPMLQQDASSSGYHPRLGEKKLSRLNPSEKKPSFRTSCRGGSRISSGEGNLGSNNLPTQHSRVNPEHLGSNDLCAEEPRENHQPRAFIDLNIPIPLDDEPFTMEERQYEKTSQELDVPHLVTPSECRPTSEQQPAVSSRRQSTRNRPLTTKVLEALAYGFLDTKQKRKGRDAFAMDDPKPRPSRRTRTRERAPDSFDTSIPDFNMQETRSAASNANSELDHDASGYMTAAFGRYYSP